jgi:hypothetical protein
MQAMKTYNSPVVSFAMMITLIVSCPVVATATLIFNAGTEVATQTTPFVNNLIDLNLSDFANNAVTPLSGYTSTQGDTISGSVTRNNLTTGSLLGQAEFNTLIALNQAANQLSGVINFSGGSGVNDANAFIGTNATGSLTLNASISLATAFQTRTFSSDVNATGTGSSNSGPISGNGFLNIGAATFTLSDPVSAFGFTQLHRDGTRNYTWSVQIRNLDTLVTQTISLGGISTAGLRAGAHPGDTDAGNYGYDIFVGYEAPEGFGVTQVILGGGFMNVDGFAYASVVPEPTTISMLGLGALLTLAARRRRHR